jgi:hypothetical protein
VASRHVIAVDWSGRADRSQAESIWVAEASGERLVFLRNGMTRDEVAVRLIEAANHHDGLTVGLDFAFSVPAWWARDQAFSGVRDVWRLMVNEGEELIRDKRAPFWGSAGSVALPPDRRFRRTDERLRAAALPAKSVFQLAGAGAVGVGSLRGMPYLLALSDLHGFSVWPFDPPGAPQLLEIYPRALTGPVDKGRWASRREYLQARFSDHDPVMLERAAGSEDAFDAAVSALVMAAHIEEIEALQQTADPIELLEGRIWVPRVLLPAA